MKDGQAIGIGAGQQSRIHCTRLAGSKADEWWLRQCPKVMNLPFKEKIRRADRDNTINVYISDEWEDVLQDGVWEQFFTEKPEPLTREEKKAWIAQNTGVCLGSDAFFPFGDNIERAHKSGVEYIAQLVVLSVTTMLLRHVTIWYRHGVHTCSLVPPLIE